MRKFDYSNPIKNCERKKRYHYRGSASSIVRGPILRGPQIILITVHVIIKSSGGSETKTGIGGVEDGVVVL